MKKCTFTYKMEGRACTVEVSFSYIDHSLVLTGSNIQPDELVIDRVLAGQPPHRDIVEFLTMQQLAEISLACHDYREMEAA